MQVRRHFRPELLNRLDEIVVFDPLSHDQLRKVARLQMKDVAVRLAERGVALAVTDAALDVILSLAYDPVRDSISIDLPFQSQNSEFLYVANSDFVSTTENRCMARGRSGGGSRRRW